MPGRRFEPPPWDERSPSSDAGPVFPRADRRPGGGPAHEVWAHLRAVFGDRGTAIEELAESMLAAGAVIGEPRDVRECLETLLAELLTGRYPGHRVEVVDERYRARLSSGSRRPTSAAAPPGSGGDSSAPVAP